MGWRTLSLNINVGVGHFESIGTSSSIVLASPNGDRYGCLYDKNLAEINYLMLHMLE